MRTAVRGRAHHIDHILPGHPTSRWVRISPWAWAQRLERRGLPVPVSYEDEVACSEVAPGEDIHGLPIRG